MRGSPTAFARLGPRGEHPDFDRRVTRRGDDVVIEGYPRSGNTFGTMAFRLAQPNPLNIGNHFHAPAQIGLARRYGIPAMVVVREPMAAALSFCVYHQGKVSAAAALKTYIAFHKPLAAWQDAWIPAPFEEVISDFGTSIARLNAHFGSDFAIYHSSPEADARTQTAVEEKRLKRLARRGDTQASAARQTTPSAAKEALKANFRDQFAAPNIEPLKAEAAALYAQVLAHPTMKNPTS